jgi:predicted transcriptional regulator
MRFMMHRNRIDIISQIMEAANGGTSKSRIMYKVHLSSAQIKEVLMALTESDLLRYEEDTRILRTTEKGLRFLDTYIRISDMLNVEQPQQQMWIHREEQTA